MKYPIKELSLAIGVMIVGFLALTAAGAQEVKTVITQGGQTITSADVQAGDTVEAMLEQGQVKTVKLN